MELLSTDESLQANINQLIAMESQDDVFGDASADLSPGTKQFIFINVWQYRQSTVAKKQQRVLVNWGLKERWFRMVLRVLNQILEAPKLGKTPRAYLGPIWPDLAKIWPNQIDFGNPQG